MKSVNQVKCQMPNNICASIKTSLDPNLNQQNRKNSKRSPDVLAGHSTAIHWKNVKHVHLTLCPVILTDLNAWRRSVMAVNL